MKTNYKLLKNFSLMILALLALASCNNKNGDSPGPQKEKTMKDLVISNNFEWKTSKPANLIITAKDNEGQPIAGAKFSIFTDNPENGGKLIVSGVTNTTGIYSVDYSVPAYYSALYVRSDYVGLPTPGMVSLDNNGFDITLGGKEKNTRTVMVMVFPITLMIIPTILTKHLITTISMRANLEHWYLKISGLPLAIMILTMR